MQLQDYLFESTVTVGGGGRSGTGFFVAPGLVVTAGHLVEDADGSDYPLAEVTISREGVRLTARVLGYAAGPDPDLAILEVDSDDSFPAAYMYAPFQAGDALHACGRDAGAPVAAAIPSAVRMGHLLRLDAEVPQELAGAPVLNLRTGGVTAVVTRASAAPSSVSPDAPGRLPASATPVSTIARLFPGVFGRHDRHHQSAPAWFTSTGVRGTVFAAREHIVAIRDTCETPIQPLITPLNGRAPVDLAAPVRFLEHSSGPVADRLGPETTIEEVLERSREAGRSVLLTGPTGSGRSSVLRALGLRASSAFGNLGSLDQGPFFPVLLRANQLQTDGRPVEDAVIASMEKGNEAMTGMDLPPRFLTDLARSPGVRLLLMIDGMDEIQNSRDIAELVDLIGRIQDAPGFGQEAQLLVTARPSATEYFRYSRFDVCEIQPLSAPSIRVAAERWLGREAGAFLESNRDLVASGLLSSPLVLAVALKLYETGPGELPPRVVELYRTLISRLAAERRAELAGKYGPEVADNAVDLLGFVALELLRSATVMDETWVRTTAARYFESHLGLDGDTARARAESFTHFAAADSHFIGPAGSRFFWSHLSFRDYFAASCLVRLSTHEMAANEIRRRWFDSNWGRTPSFALQLLGDESARLGIVGEVLDSGRPARFAFVTELLREGARLPAGLLEAFVRQLVGEIGREKDLSDADTLGGAVARDLLRSLGHLPEARPFLDELALGEGHR